MDEWYLVSRASLSAQSNRLMPRKASEQHFFHSREDVIVYHSVALMNVRVMPPEPELMESNDKSKPPAYLII